MDGLEAATRQELVDELARRNTATVIILLGPHDNAPGEECFSVHYSGGLTLNLGMVERARMDVKADVILAERVDIPDEEDDE